MAETDRHAAWRDYYETTGARPPRETLVAALDAFAREGRDPGFAIDLGCGNGRDTIAMLARRPGRCQIRGESSQESAGGTVTAQAAKT